MLLLHVAAATVVTDVAAVAAFVSCNGRCLLMLLMLLLLLPLHRVAVFVSV